MYFFMSMKLNGGPLSDITSIGIPKIGIILEYFCFCFSKITANNLYF